MCPSRKQLQWNARSFQDIPRSDKKYKIKILQNSLERYKSDRLGTAHGELLEVSTLCHPFLVINDKHKGSTRRDYTADDSNVLNDRPTVCWSSRHCSISPTYWSRGRPQEQTLQARSWKGHCSSCGRTRKRYAFRNNSNIPSRNQFPQETKIAGFRRERDVAAISKYETKLSPLGCLGFFSPLRSDRTIAIDDCITFRC